MLGKLLPNCFAALRLVERGTKRPLSTREKLLLRYHSPLCPHCNCARHRFQKSLKDMEKARRDGYTTNQSTPGNDAETPVQSEEKNR